MYFKQSWFDHVQVNLTSFMPWFSSLIYMHLAVPYELAGDDNLVLLDHGIFKGDSAQTSVQTIYLTQTLNVVRDFF